jgi:PAS domain S-box-containing protein
MAGKLRKMGIDLIGDVPWGTHLCQFYQTKEDLIDILLPYFQAGLENNELCIWVTSKPLPETEAKETMRKAVPDFDRYLKREQIEIVPCTEWYLKDGAFNLQRVLGAWIDKLKAALVQGFEGLRVTGNTAWLEKRDWKNFADYEEKVNQVIGKYRMIAICSYCLNRCGAPDVIDVVSHHQFALIRREGEWKLIESSDRKQKITELERSAKEWQTTFDAISDIVALISPDFELIRLNRAGYESLGKKPEELIGKKCYEIMHGLDTPVDGCPCSETVKTKKAGVGRFTQEGRHYIATASPILDKNHELTAFAHTVKDITDIKKTEEALRESEEKYRSLVNYSNDIVCRADESGNFTFLSPAVKMILGYEPEEMVGRSVFDFMFPEDTSSTREAHESVVREGRTFWEYENRWVSKDGRVITLAWNVTALRDKQGNIIGTQGVGRDITQRKKVEEALIQSEKLRVLGEMAGGVAHDFNNLLAIILGNAQLLEKGLERYKQEEIKHRLQIIARTAYEGGETVRRLQHFTGREVSDEDFTRLDLNEIVKAAIASTSPRWKDEAEAKGATIKIKERLGKLPPLLGSRSELMEVLTNLIFNSVEAMPEGGEITIRTEAKENKAYLYFTDTGKGIPNRIKKKIFDPFFTTKGPKASGLGLSTCYGIIKRHKGAIKIESTEGKGAIFTIGIPVPLEIPLKKGKLKEPEKISSREILVIDDEEGVRDILGRIFQDESHRVTLAETARKGLAKFKQANFDLVLTDLGMPEMSGWQLAKKIKEIDPDVPVGLITGWTVATTKEKMKEEGVDFILPKPFDLTKVVREVNAALKSKKR